MATNIIDTSCGCSGLLAGGVFEVWRSNRDEHTKQDLLQFVSYSTYDEFKHAKNNDTGVDYSDGYKEYKFNNDWGQSDFEKHQRDLRTQYQLHDQKDIRDTLFRQYASAVIVNGFNQCIKNCADRSKLSCWFDPDYEKNIVLTVHNGTEGTLPELTEKIGVTKGGRFTSKQPKTLKAGDNVFTIERSENVELIVTVKTTHGDVYAIIPKSRTAPPDPNADLKDLQLEYKGWRAISWGGGAPKTFMKVAGKLLKYAGQSINYTVDIDSYHKFHPYKYRHRILVDGKEVGVIQSNEYPHYKGIGNDKEVFQDVLTISATGDVSIEVQVVEFEGEGAGPIDFDIADSSIKTSFR